MIGPLCCGSPRDFVPDLEPLGHDVAIGGGREPVASWTEVLGDGTIGGEEPLGMSWGLEALHAPLPLACRLMRVLGAAIEIDPNPTSLSPVAIRLRDDVSLS